MSSSSTESVPMLPPRVEVRRTRLADPWTYARLDARQREIAREIGESGAPGALLLSELSPVITFGRRATDSELLMSREALTRLGVELYPTDRGGLATYHGPGQWVLFVVDRLDRLTGDSRGVRKAVETLLELARDLGCEYGERAEIRSGMETGVWTPSGKFAAVGVHVQDRVLLHGLSINGFKTPTSFVGLRPCGLDAPVDFLLKKEGEGGFERMGNRIQQLALERFWKKY